jgi:pullulanase/glycogen debranching enzyme
MDRSDSTCFPLGPAVYGNGVNFSVFSKNADAVELLLFDNVDDAAPARVIRLDPEADRTYHYWHVFVPGLMPGQVYGWRAHGPFAPERGQRFDAAPRSFSTPMRRRWPFLTDTAAWRIRAGRQHGGCHEERCGRPR